MAKTLDHTQTEEDITSQTFIAKGDFRHGVSAIPAKSILQNIGKNDAQKSRLAGVAERFLKEREKKCPTLGIIQQGEQSGRSSNALLYAQLGSCAESIEANMQFARKRAWHLYKITGTFVQACEKCLRPPNRTTQQKSCRISVRLRT